MTDVKLLPLPEFLLRYYKTMPADSHEAECKHYAHACVEAALSAQPRQAEALRDALEYLQHHLPDEMLAPHRAALQETGNADVRILAEPGEVG